MEEMKRKKKRHHRGRRKKASKRAIISNIILVVAVAVFLFSGFKLYTIYSEYHKGEKEYDSVTEDVVKKVVVEAETENEDGETVIKEREVLNIDFEKLQSTNPEVVAWIDFEEPSKISYPVMHTDNNDKYLTKTFEGKSNSSGALFVDAYNAGDFSDRNTFIYGHNMKNGSMFSQLRKYKTEEFCKENPYFYIYTPDGIESKYQIFSVCIVEDTSETYIKTYANDTEFLKYIEYIRGISRYDVDVEVTAQSQIVSLSTCTNVTETQRLVVHGVKIEELILDAELVDATAESAGETADNAVTGE